MTKTSKRRLAQQEDSAQFTDCNYTIIAFSQDNYMHTLLIEDNDKLNESWSKPPTALQCPL
jgi:hypothetical protein